MLRAEIGTPAGVSAISTEHHPPFASGSAVSSAALIPINEQLAQLIKFRNEGEISVREFEEAKKKLLSMN